MRLPVEGGTGSNSDGDAPAVRSRGGLLRWIEGVIASGLACLVVLVQTGCGAPGPLAAWKPTTLDRPAVLTGAHMAADPPPPAEAGVLWYVGEAIESNPRIRAARQRVERLRARVPQAKAPLDPEASVTLGELAQTAAGQIDFVIGLRQAMPFPGTLDARGEVARQEAIEALHDLAAVVVEVAAETQRAFWSCVGAGREAAVLRETAALLAQIEAAVQARVRVGAGRQGDALRVARERVALENEVSRVLRRRETSAAVLTRLLSRPVSEEPTAAELTWTVREFDVDRLRALARSANPDAAAARARVATFRQRLKVARHERLPELRAGLQYGAVGDGLASGANGDDQFAVTLGTTLPIWFEADDAAEREALRGIAQSLAEVRAAEDRAAYLADEALAEITTDQVVLQRLQTRLIPDSRQVVELSLARYRTGEGDFLRLLDDWQVWLQDRRREVQVAAGLHRALVDLEAALAGPVPVPVPEPRAAIESDPVDAPPAAPPAEGAFP